MDTLTAFTIIAISALIHASFQLGTSMVTLLSSHTIGKKRSQSRLLLLTNSFVFGVIIMTMLLVSFAGMAVLRFDTPGTHQLVWMSLCGIFVALGIAVWLFYYRRERGTVLWIPRGFASFLGRRTKKTSQAAEAFSLGMSSVVGELVFIFAPILAASLALVQLSPQFQLLGLLVYTLVSSLSLLIVSGLIGAGHSISRIQKWRETNKHFLQFAAGSGMLVLGFYLYVNEVAVAALQGGV